MAQPVSPDSTGSVSSFGEVLNIINAGGGFGNGNKYQSPRLGVTMFDTIDEERGTSEGDRKHELASSIDGEFAWGSQRDLRRSEDGSVSINPKIVGGTDRFHSSQSVGGTSVNGPAVRRQKSTSNLSDETNGRGQSNTLSSSAPSAVNGYQTHGLISAISTSNPPIMDKSARTPSPSTVNSGQFESYNGIQKQPSRSSRIGDSELISQSGFVSGATGHRSHEDNRSYISTTSHGSLPFSSGSMRSKNARRPSMTSESSDVQHPFASPAFATGLMPTEPRSTPALSKPTIQQPQHQVSLVSEEDMANADDETCPICVESLNSSYRLPGERAHITPICGHSLHHVREGQIFRVGENTR
jgi:hypothetical protein